MICSIIFSIKLRFHIQILLALDSTMHYLVATAHYIFNPNPQSASPSAPAHRKIMPSNHELCWPFSARPPKLNNWTENEQERGWRRVQKWNGSIKWCRIYLQQPWCRRRSEFVSPSSEFDGRAGNCLHTSTSGRICPPHLAKRCLCFVMCARGMSKPGLLPSPVVSVILTILFSLFTVQLVRVRFWWFWDM